MDFEIDTKASNLTPKKVSSYSSKRLHFTNGCITNLINLKASLILTERYHVQNEVTNMIIVFLSEDVTHSAIGLRKLLNWVQYRYNNTSVYITANGLSDNNSSVHDWHRIHYMRLHTNQLLKGLLSISLFLQDEEKMRGERRQRYSFD